MGYNGLKFGNSFGILTASIFRAENVCTLKTDVEGSFKMLISIYQTTQCYIPENNNLQAGTLFTLNRMASLTLSVLISKRGKRHQIF
jgi:hypothetical protein